MCNIGKNERLLVDNAILERQLVQLIDNIHDGYKKGSRILYLDLKLSFLRLKKKVYLEKYFSTFFSIYMDLHELYQYLQNGQNESILQISVYFVNK